MSLLTKEQQKDIADIREINRLRHDLATGGEAIKDVDKLLSVIDDLQSRHSERKQYTEQKHFSEFEKVYPPLEGVAHKQIFKGWLMCARFLGALKAEP